MLKITPLPTDPKLTDRELIEAVERQIKETEQQISETDKELAELANEFFGE